MTKELEEKIDGLFENVEQHKIYCKDMFVSEIASLFEGYYPKEFVEWLHDNTDDTRVEDSNLWWVIPLEDYLPLDELYLYWQNNIKDK